MPCNAKKYEAGRPEFSTGGVTDVDGVLTTNDVIAMLAERHIDPRQIEPGEVDAFFGKAWVWQHGPTTLGFWTLTLLLGAAARLVFRRLQPHFADVL